MGTRINFFQSDRCRTPTLVGAKNFSSPSANHFLLTEDYNKKTKLVRLRDVPYGNPAELSLNNLNEEAFSP